MKIEVSARHIHLAQEDLEKLFGPDFKLEQTKELSQHGQFVSQARLTIVGPKRQIENVAVLGPIRSQTQIEISRTDAYFLGAEAPLRISGDLKGSGAIKLIGPAGEAELSEGLIVAKRHIHLSPDQAKDLGVDKGDIIKVTVSGDRALIFDQVVVRIDKNFDQAVQVDTDEGNAAGISGIGECEFNI